MRLAPVSTHESQPMFNTDHAYLRAAFMATTTFFEEQIKDLKEPISVDLEFGRSSYYGGINRLYVKIDGRFMVLVESQGQRLCAAMDDLRAYLQYDNP